MPPELSEYISAAGDSTARARTALGFIMTAALLTFAAYWNAQNSFLEKRINAFANAAFWAPRLVSGTCAQKPATPAEAQACEAALRLIAAHPGFDLLHTPSATISATLQKDLEELQRQYLGNLHSIKVPLVDVVIDYGDLWVFAGMGFAILLLWLVYAIACEVRDTKRVFAVADEADCGRVAYDLLAMRQLFTIPPGTRGTASTVLWRIIPKLFFFFPLLAESFGLAAEVLNRSWYAMHPGVSFAGRVSSHLALLLVTVWLTVKCFALEDELDTLWDTQAANLRRSEGLVGAGTPSELVTLDVGRS